MPVEYTAVIGYVDGSDTWEERLPVPDDADPEGYIKQVVDDFNEEETDRYGERARLRKVISINKDSGVRMCEWTRVNAVTLTDSKGLYNLYKCGVCGLVVRTSAMKRPGEKECHPERVCTICSKEFKSDKNLEKHMARKHSEEY